ncbi:MAG: hypothetical protein KIT36_02810 [Alphaproteobacteria bacterium]|nr:hypothetical protein [Alphaproteobacteria bacterium]
MDRMKGDRANHAATVSTVNGSDMDAPPTPLAARYAASSMGAAPAKTEKGGQTLAEGPTNCLAFFLEARGITAATFPRAARRKIGLRLVDPARTPRHAGSCTQKHSFEPE